MLQCARAETPSNHVSTRKALESVCGNCVGATFATGQRRLAHMARRCSLPACPEGRASPSRNHRRMAPCDGICA
eukprot:8997874-Alexandrium_andersonii.AAC.1